MRNTEKKNTTTPSDYVKHIEPPGEIGKFEFPEMKVAHVIIKGGIDLEMRAIDWVYGTRLPASGYVPDNQPAFEAWIGRPFAHGYEHFELAMQLPIKKDR